MFLHEGAAALLDADQPALFQFTHRAANGVPVDGELGGELGLRGQLFAREIELVADVVRQRFADLPPDGDAGTSFNHMGARIVASSSRMAVIVHQAGAPV